MTGRGSHDVLAKRIAEAAHHWTQTHARREDMTAYMFRYDHSSIYVYAVDTEFIALLVECSSNMPVLLAQIVKL